MKRLLSKLAYLLATLTIPTVLFFALLNQGWSRNEPLLPPSTHSYNPTIKKGVAYWQWPVLRSTQTMYRHYFITPSIRGGKHEAHKAPHPTHR